MVPTCQTYRADCRTHRDGCRNCGSPVPNHRAYCSNCICDGGRDTFEREHFWSSASAFALLMASPFGPATEFLRQPWIGDPICSKCGKACGTLTYAREAEVNHIVPLLRQKHRVYYFGCFNHQDNLEVVCHDCHVVITTEQRRSRRPPAVVAARSEPPVSRASLPLPLDAPQSPNA